jgi:uncharacterized protein YhdP
VKRSFSILRRSLEVLFLAVLVALALYVSLGRVLLLAISAETWAGWVGAAMGAKVVVTTSEGDWLYLDPRLKLSGVCVSDCALAIDSVQLRINAIRSVIEQRPVVAEVLVDGLRLDVRRDADGEWFVVGVPRGDRSLTLGDVLDAMPHLHQVSLTNVRAHVITERAAFDVETTTSRLSTLGDERHFSGEVTIRTDTESLNFEMCGRYRGDPRSETFAADVYARLPVIAAGVLAPLSVDLPGGVTISDVKIGGELWLHAEAGAVTVLGDILLPSLQVSHRNESSTPLIDVEGLFRADLDVDGGWHVMVSHLGGMVGGEAWNLDQLQVVGSNRDDGQVIAGYLPILDLSAMTRAAITLDKSMKLLPESVREALYTVQPAGSLSGLSFRTSTTDPVAAARLTARISSGQINAYLGSPSVTNLNGVLSLSRDHGFIDIENGPFKLHLKRIFDEVWSFDQGRGRFEFQRDGDRYQLFSHAIELVDGDLTAFGQIHLNLEADPAKRSWGLMLGLRNGDLIDAERYFPAAMSPDLRDWLTRAVVDGTVAESGLLFHGSLFRKSAKIERLQEMFFAVEGGVLDYDPAWPRVGALEATIYTGNWGVETRGAVGVIYDSSVSIGEVVVPMNDEAPALWVHVDGTFEGPVNDGIRFLNETPLAGITSRVAEHWSGAGDMQGAARLEIPIGTDAAARAALTDVDLLLSDNAIEMPDFDLVIDRLDGLIRYQNESGLTSSDLTGRLFERPVSGTIATTSGDNTAIRFDVAGRVTAEALYAWTDQPILSRASGESAYEATLFVPQGEVGVAPGEGIEGVKGDNVVGDAPDASLASPWIEVTSDLAGIELRLPHPLGVTREGSANLRYRHVFDSVQEIAVALNDDFAVTMHVDDDQLTAARAHFGPRAKPLAPGDGILITGVIDQVDYHAWEVLMEDLEAVSDPSMSSELIDALTAIELKAGILHAYGVDLEDASARVTRAGATWQIELANEMLRGVLGVPDAAAEPVSVHLDYLRVDADEESPDPMADVVPQQLGPMVVSIDEFRLDDEDYGKWSFHFSPTRDGGYVDQLEAEVRGLLLQADSRLYWDHADGRHSTRYEGTVVAPDLGLALRAWGYASSIEGDNFQFRPFLNWEGSPAMIDMKTVGGTMRLDAGEGRFVQVESAGALKLLGIFDFSSIARRFRFDFRDVTNEGYTFSKIEGDTRFQDGLIQVVNPIVIEGSGSIFKLGGNINLISGELDNDMIVTLPVNRNLPWYAAYSAIAAGPLAGVGVIVAQRIFQNQIDQISSAKYKITGSIDAPVIEFVSIFDDNVREEPSAAGPAPGKLDGLPPVDDFPASPLAVEPSGDRATTAEIDGGGADE